MVIFELTRPGLSLVGNEQESVFMMQTLLSHLETAFFEANIALNLFDAASIRQLTSNKRSNEQWEKDRERRSEIELLVRKEMNLQPYDRHEDIRFEVDVRFKREKWAQGDLPWELKHTEIFVHAKSFLYAMDTMYKLLGVLSNEEGAPKQLQELHKQIEVEFPDLKGVRNSTQHLEDRARGLDDSRPPKKIKFKAVENEFFYSPEGALMINNILNTKFGTTMAKGRYGEVDVCFESLAKINVIIQSALNAFEWTGPRCHLPN